MSLNVVLYVPLGLLVLVQWAAFPRVAALDAVLIHVAGGVLGIILGALFLRVLGVRGWVRGEPDPKLEVS